MRYLASAAFVFLAACGPPSPGPVVQRLLDEYAPALPIGQRVTAEARERYRLQQAANQGYSDYTYQGLDGVRGLTVRLDLAPGDGSNERVSPRAKVRGVQFWSPTAETTARIDARIRAVLGEPRIFCYTGGFARRIETRYWPAENGRGVLFLVFRDSLPDMPKSVIDAQFELGWGIVEFGAEPVSPQQVDLRECD